jgi:hypothetical protein
MGARKQKPVQAVGSDQRSSSRSLTRPSAADSSEAALEQGGRSGQGDDALRIADLPLLDDAGLDLRIGVRREQAHRLA